MAVTTITVNGDNSNIILLEIKEEQNTSCSSLFNIISNHNIGEVLNITTSNIIGTFNLQVNDSNYISEGNNYTSTTINEYILIITNSGVNGVFNTVTLNFNNITTGLSDSVTVTRLNDDQPC